MSLRHRGYLREATYKKDREYRDVAEHFYHALVKFLKSKPDRLVYRKSDGGYSIVASEFWRHPLAKKLGVVFTPEHGRLSGGVGKAGKFDVLVFPIMLGPGDRRHLDTRLRQDVVVHEMIHFLDPGRDAGQSSAAKFDSGRESDYYNSPGEWNAYWQEGAAAVERFLRAPMVSHSTPEQKAKIIKTFFGGTTLKDVYERANKFWDQGFLENMTQKTERKFRKRLAQLWKSLKDRGML